VNRETEHTPSEPGAETRMTGSALQPTDLGAQAESATPDLSAIGALASAIDNCYGYNGRLAERADWEAEFWLHSSHDPDAIKALFYEQTRNLIATLFSDDYPFPDVAFFADHRNDLTELVSQGLRNCSSMSGGFIRLAVPHGEGSTTVEAALNAQRCGIRQEAPVHVFQTDASGGRSESRLLFPGLTVDYQAAARLLDLAAEEIAEHEEQLPSAD
jgi:hypothetical protein